MALSNPERVGKALETYGTDHFMGAWRYVSNRWAQPGKVM